MNEVIFLSHIIVLLSIIHLFSKFGKNGLITIFVLQIIFANLFILKQTMLFNWIVTTTDCYSIGSFITLNMIRENYGYKISNKTILIGLCSILFLPAMSIFLLSYDTIPDNLFIHDIYKNLLTPSLRIFITSIICMVTFQKIDTGLYSYLRKKMSLRYSMILSLSITQFFDTLCFTYIGLSGILNNLIDIVIFSYLIKIITILIMSPASKILIRKES